MPHHTHVKIKKLETIIGWFLSNKTKCVRVRDHIRLIEIDILYDSFMSDYVSRISSNKREKRSRFVMETERDQFKISKKKKTNNESCNSHILRPNRRNLLRTKRRASVQKHFRRNWIEANKKSALFLFLSASRNKNPQREGARCGGSQEKTNSFVNGFPLFKIRMGCNGW